MLWVRISARSSGRLVIGDEEELTMPRSIIRLIVLHARLDRAVRAELRRRAPDPLRLARLKKLRLAVKDRLSVENARALRAA